MRKFTRVLAKSSLEPRSFRSLRGELAQLYTVPNGGLAVPAGWNGELAQL
jgi:hypothetical protein